MPDVRYVCPSDLHPGAENSILTGLLPGKIEVDLRPQVGLSWQAAGAVIAVGVAYVLRGPAKAQEATAAMGTPLDSGG